MSADESEFQDVEAQEELPIEESVEENKEQQESEEPTPQDNQDKTPLADSESEVSSTEDDSTEDSEITTDEGHDEQSISESKPKESEDSQQTIELEEEEEVPPTIKYEMKDLVEAALFLAGRSLTIDEIAEVLQTESRDKINSVLDELCMEYAQRDSPIDLVQEAEFYKLELRSQYLTVVKDLAPQMDMTGAVLKTLSFIAYKQPIKQSEVVEKFGNRVYDYVSELTKRGLIKADRTGHTKLLSTTTELLEYLGEEDGVKIQRAFEKAKVERDIIKLKRKGLYKKPKPKKEEDKPKEPSSKDLLSKKDLSMEDWQKAMGMEEEENKRKEQEKFLKQMEKIKKQQEKEKAAKENS